MEIDGKRVLICDCEGSIPLDGDALAKAFGGSNPQVVSQLCRAQIGEFQRAVLDGRPMLVACTQEAPLFDEVMADSTHRTRVTYANIREQAGWSVEGREATPKIAALLAEAVLDVPKAPTVTTKSEGVVAIYGMDERAIEAAKQLAGRLDITVFLDNPKGVMPPSLMDVPVFKGSVKAASGHLGAFEMIIDNYAVARPSSRRELTFEPPMDGKVWTCDLILDITGGTPLFPAPEKREGYFNPDPNNPVLVQKAIFDLAGMVGEIEKPLFIDFDAAVCAHSRARLTGCTRCLDVCPTGAIEPAGNHVSIDPYVCAGCGNCAAVCPTGAASYAIPAGNALFERLRTLLAAFRKAGGGEKPVLLVHDGRRGIETIDIIARLGRGLPARVLPFAVNEVTQIGFDFFVVALAYGVGQVRVMSGGGKPDELVELSKGVALAETVARGLGYGEGRAALIDEQDPSVIEEGLYALASPAGPEPGDFLPVGGKRAVTKLALHRLHEHAPSPVEYLSLPKSAPFGTLDIDVAGCSICLSCVGVCPTGALQGTEETRRLSFVEDACVQCGLCRATCPEKVIKLVPRLNFTETARNPAVIKQDEAFECVRCGKPFGIKSFIEAIARKLVEAPEAAIERIKMCDQCRLESFHKIDDHA